MAAKKAQETQNQVEIGEPSDSRLRRLRLFVATMGPRLVFGSNEK
jgi:hypothetical protein